MTRKNLFFLMIAGCLSAGVNAQQSDPEATAETKNLYRNLMALSGKHVLLGHQDDLAYGVNWKYEEGRSDLKELTGSYPAVFGWDVAGLERSASANIDGVPFEKMRRYIQQVYDMGAVNTISWHMDNPLNGKNAWDTTALSVKSVLPGEKKHKLYRSWLRRFAGFVRTLKGSDGRPVPILFRPFHEHSGGWFWWGSRSCGEEEYKTLWRFTLSYLRDQEQLHNLIYVFNPCDFNSEEEYLSRYPGPDYADILSFDAYQYGGIEKGSAFKAELIRKLALQQQIAMRQSKLTAIAETGFVEIPDARWWSDVLVPAMESHKPSYVLLWRNAGYRPQENDQHYYAPYPGQTSSADFLRVFTSGALLFQKELQKHHLYK